MNLWGRLSRWAWMLSVLTFLACEDPNEIGAELDPNDDNFITLFKEFSLPSSVVYYDSVTTDVPPELLVGVYDDPNFGRTKLISYTQIEGFELPTTGFQLPVNPNAVYDSAKLFLRIKYFFGDDFSSQQTIRVHTLEDTLFRTVSYKSTIETPISDEPVGELSFSTVAGIDTLLIVRMSDEYGAEMLELTKVQQITTASTDPRLDNNEIPGLAFVPDDNNSYIFAIEDNIQARDVIRVGEESILSIYYHLDSDSPIEARNFDFSIGGTTMQYINVENDRSSSALSELTEPFTEYTPANGLRYVQPLAGIYTKVDMSEVWDFVDSLDGVVINNAQLSLSNVIDRGGPDDFITTLDNVSFLFVGESNKVVPSGDDVFQPNNIEVVVLDDGSYNSQSTSAPLRISYDPDAASYDSEISEMSNFVQAVADSAINKTDLMIFPLIRNTNPNINQIRPVDQLIFPADQLKLRLYYSTIR